MYKTLKIPHTKKKNPVEHIKKLSKIAGYKINMQISVALLYTSKKLS